VERSLFLAAIEAALSLSASAENGRASVAFARQACTEWLARWPGDFRVRAHLASACIAADETDAAIQYLTQVMEADPESVEPYRALSALYRAQGQKARYLGMEACLAGLEASSLPGGQLPQWADTLLASVRLLRSGRWQEARLAAETVMREAADYPLPALVHLKAALQLADYPFVLSAGKAYRARWPGCTAFLLLMAQSCFTGSQNAAGVELLYAAAIANPASEVADRYLGSLNPYKPLWPAKMEAEIRIPVPGAVAFTAGWNKLASPPPAPGAPNLPDDIPLLKFLDFDSQNPEESPMTHSDVSAPIPGEMYAGPSGSADEKNTEPIPDAVREASPAPESKKPSESGDPTLDDLREQLNRVAARLHMRKSFADEDNRRPAYIVITSRNRLASLYGASPMGEIEQAMQNLLRTKRAQRGWSAYLIDVDNLESLQPFALKPADPANAWQVKTLIGNLDGALAKRGEMIAALLILGGHEVIPFHLLPNPTDDDDRDVPSDNPYASRDENYFVPEWPVGRIPAPPDGNVNFLLGMLRKAAETPAPVKTSLWSSIISFFFYFLRPSTIRFRSASGITAGVWRKASAEVFRVVGPSDGLLDCPPNNSKTLPKELLTRPKYSYFNLHGLENGPEWLGQTDPNSKKPEEVEFPIALLPSLVAANHPVPATVYTESCYGVNILNKGTRDAIALEFLAGGTRALVGSTKISYGAAAAPLIAADLLGKLFLQNSLQGFSAGEALQRAKLSFADEMDKRQGFLDPEDQKTLISFVLLGDPLFVAEPAAAKRAKRGTLRQRSPHLRINTLSAKADLQENGSVPSPQMQATLKKTMKRYLPGMSDSHMRYLHPRAVEADDGQGKGKPRRGKKPAATPRSPAWVVALDRKYQAHGQEFTQYAKVSMDSAGHVVKIVVSR
jgi:hypothetical protein